MVSHCLGNHKGRFCGRNAKLRLVLDFLAGRAEPRKSGVIAQLLRWCRKPSKRTTRNKLHSCSEGNWKRESLEIIQRWHMIGYAAGYSQFRFHAGVKYNKETEGSVGSRACFFVINVYQSYIKFVHAKQPQGILNVHLARRILIRPSISA